VGLNIRVGDQIDVVEHQYDHGHIRLHFCFCHYQGGAVWHQAVVDHVWAKPALLKDYRFPEANAAVVGQVIELLERPQPHILVKNPGKY